MDRFNVNAMRASNFMKTKGNVKVKYLFREFIFESEIGNYKT